MYKADYGDGRLRDCSITDGVFQKMNSYARVTKINKNVIEIADIVQGEMNQLVAGETVLIHVSATNGTDAELLGAYQFNKIELVVDNTLTLSEKVFDVNLEYFYVQIISVPQFDCLTLKDATISPPPFDPFHFVGGIVAFQVFNSFEMINSAIDLSECGIPFNRRSLRPLTEQERRGETDGAIYAGQENYLTADKFLLNAGDGAVLIQAKNFIADSESRIGNMKTHGRANCRGAADSPFKPSNISNIGGSTILIAADNLELTPEVLAKYRDSNLREGRGLARCYIASNTILPKDEKLYAFDILEDKFRVQNFGVQDFGNGSLGAADNPQYQLNNFAAVTDIVGNKIYFKDKTLAGIAPLKLGALIILQDLDSGNFIISRVLKYEENAVTLERTLNAERAQIITVAEFTNLKMESHSIKNFDGTKGGVLAIAAHDLEITGEINANVRRTLDIGNSQSWNRLQVGSIFILAEKIKFGDNARLKGDTLIIGGELVNFDALKSIGGNNFIYN